MGLLSHCTASTPRHGPATGSLADSTHLNAGAQQQRETEQLHGAAARGQWQCWLPAVSNQHRRRGADCGTPQSLRPRTRHMRQMREEPEEGG